MPNGFDIPAGGNPAQLLRNPNVSSSMQMSILRDLIAQSKANMARTAATPLAPTPQNPYFKPQGRSAQNPSQFAPQGGAGQFVGRDGQIGSRLPTTEAQNVLRGQYPGANTTMRPLNIPGYTMVGNQMVPNRRLPQPSTANVANKGLGGMTPNAFRTAQQAMRNGTTPPVNISPEAQSILNAQARAAANPHNANGLTSFQQTSMNRMARRRGVRGGDVRAWIQQSPAAQANMQSFQARNGTLPAKPPALPASQSVGGSLLASSGLPTKLGSDAYHQMVALLRQYKTASDDETSDDPVTEAENLKTLRNQGKKTLDPQARGFFGGKVAECDECQKPGSGGTHGEELCDGCGESPCACSAVKKLAKAAADAHGLTLAEGGLLGTGLGTVAGYLKHRLGEYLSPSEDDEARRQSRNRSLLGGALLGGGLGMIGSKLDQRNKRQVAEWRQPAAARDESIRQEQLVKDKQVAEWRQQAAAREETIRQEHLAKYKEINDLVDSVKQHITKAKEIADGVR